MLYNALLLFLSPFIHLLLWLRLWQGKESLCTRGERWGRYPADVFASKAQPRIWVHAVSVGEVMAAVPVLRELRARFPDAFLLLTTTTVGGREVAERQVPPADAVLAFPLDFPNAARRAFEAVRPNVVILMEWEIWPNFVHAVPCPIVVLNGRISEKGLRRGTRFRWMMRNTLRQIRLFMMQSAEDTRRAVLVGVPESRVVVMGNTKFDEAVRVLSPAERAALRHSLGILPDVPVLVCGSTRPGEEIILADAIVRLLPRFPLLRVVVAPRHLDRVDDAELPFAALNLPVLHRTRQKESGDSVDRILLLDTFGELAQVYAIADVAFVGGSLMPFGGQSVFQPLAQGVPTLFGMHMNNQRDIAALAQSAEVGFVVQDAASFADTFTRLLSLPPDEITEIRKRARHLIEANQGVARRCVDVVADILGKP